MSINIQNYIGAIMLVVMSGMFHQLIVPSIGDVQFLCSALQTEQDFEDIGYQGTLSLFHSVTLLIVRITT